MKEIHVFNREDIETYITGFNHIVISVRSPITEKATLPDVKSRQGELFLAFHDICEKGKEIVEQYKDKEADEFILFSDEDAKKILDFVKKHSDVNTILVNCEAGISRSAGIAGALAKIYNNDDFYFFRHYCPNSLVYNTILRVYHETKESNS